MKDKLIDRIERLAREAGTMEERARAAINEAIVASMKKTPDPVPAKPEHPMLKKLRAFGKKVDGTGTALFGNIPEESITWGEVKAWANETAGQ